MLLIQRASLTVVRYLSDPEATRDSHDSDGYFKTGDIARREGIYYFILGRASVDSRSSHYCRCTSYPNISAVIKSGGYKISALDIEREILGLSYISEVMVVGVEDDEFGQRVAAAVTLRDSVSFCSAQENCLLC
jgi:malonyl-CoA/methylmalonyl-CoA synthetase